MTKRLNICVFCGSSGRVDETYRNAASALGRRLGERGFDLVYGGGRVGLMGLVADAALLAGSRVTGIIPRFLEEYEVGHQGLSELIVTESMHDRKRAMYDRADAFISLPGGLGTLDETFEVITWTQLGLTDKPIILVDIDGYWSPLVGLIDHCVERGFATAANRSIVEVVGSADAALDYVGQARRPSMSADSKWL